MCECLCGFWGRVQDFPATEGGVALRYLFSNTYSLPCKCNLEELNPVALSPNTLGWQRRAW